VEPRFLTAGDSAISIQLGDEISLEVNQKVLALQAELTEHPIDGITEMVPTYASLMIHYSPEKIRKNQLED
jgi:allophanate hydrolase subunit 1